MSAIRLSAARLSATRLSALALLGAVLTLPALAEGEAHGAHGEAAAPARHAAMDTPEVMPKVTVTETDRRLLVSKPAVLRYAVTLEIPSRLAAESRGKEPERLARRDVAGR